MTSMTSIRLHTLHIRPNGALFTVEDPHSGDFYEMPPICIDAIHMLEEGMPLNRIEEVLRRKYPEEEVDMTSFVEQLMEFGLVKEMDGRKIERTETGTAGEGQLSWIPVRFARLVFNRITQTLFGFLFAANIALLIAFPGLFPRYTDWFVFPSMTANMLVWMAVSLLLLLFHELGHFLAVRAEGLPARIGIGYRLFFIVLETEMNGIWGLPKRRRFLPLLAGLCFDHFVLFSILVWKLSAHDLTGTASGLLTIVIYAVILNMMFQCLFFMKTDLYYVLEQATGNSLLLENSRNWLSGFIPFMRSKDGAVLYPGEQKAVKWYGVFYAAGLFVSGAILIVYLLPQLFVATVNSFRQLKEPAGSIFFWDGVVFLAQLVLFAGLFVYARRKESRARGG
ncbi:hypothetical protein [Paenibacillus sp. MBLB4367]|uniref:hypothetical protein n=1 Tax=Paenibacillus sp. MBLB4367 TaxID=3384767 RepID=UPI00390819BA